MASKFYIVTGASRGLGAALVEALIDPAHHLVCMARSEAVLVETCQRAAALGCRIDVMAIDFGEPVSAAAALERRLSHINPAEFECACLVNNAGIVEPIRPANAISSQDFLAGMNVNLATPMALTATFLRLTTRWPAQRKVLNISSGAAHTAYAGWSMYCATKAGLDHFSRCVALEQAAQPNGARIVALAPGIIDTDMQEAIRRTAIEDFRDRPRFVALKESGQLATAQDTAMRLLRYLDRADFGSKVVDDLRHH